MFYVVFEVVWVIIAKCHSYIVSMSRLRCSLHSLDVPIKMFANSIAVLNQQIPGNTDHTHSFQTQLMKGCLVVWLWVDKRPVCCNFLYGKQSGYPDQVLVKVSGIDLKFTFCSEILLSLYQAHGEVHVSVHACTNGYSRCTKCEVHEKRVPRFLILAVVAFVRSAASIEFLNSVNDVPW